MVCNGGSSQKHLGIVSLVLWVVNNHSQAACFPSREFLNVYQYLLNVLAENAPASALHTTCSPHLNGDSVSTRCVSHLRDVGLFLIP